MRTDDGRRSPWGAGSATRSWRPERIDVDEEALRSTVAELLRARRGPGATVAGLSREPSPFATLFPADVLRVRTGDGTELRLFLKHLGGEESDHPDKAGPEKEILVYRELLREAGLPVPRFWGARRNPASGRHEMFLEYVDGWTLENHGLEAWYRAARELGRLHRRFARPSALRPARGTLPRLGAAYARDWARRAEREASRRGGSLGSRVRALLDGYGPVTSLLEEAPRTLVHNDLSPKNVVADTGRDPTRIRFVDWESAGIGCGLLDLTNLSYGLDRPERERMRRAYRDGLDGRSGRDAGGALSSRLEAACEAHKALWRLAHCGVWGLQDEAAEGFAAEAEAAVRRAGSARPAGKGR